MQHNQGVPASPSGLRPCGAEPQDASQAEPLVPNAAPWWRCIHCGHNEYEEHVFTGHMKGVPMVHCAKCKALHSQPDPNSKAALHWKISEMAEALRHISEGCGMLSQPAALNAPEIVWLSRQLKECERVATEAIAAMPTSPEIKE